MRQFRRVADHGQVALFHAALLELRLKRKLGFLRLGQTQAARGEAIQPMHQTRPTSRSFFFLGVVCCFIHVYIHDRKRGLEPAQQRIHNGATHMTRSGMRDHARRLVDDPKLGIFKKGWQIDCFRQQMAGRGRHVRQVRFDDVASF